MNPIWLITGTIILTNALTFSTSQWLVKGKPNIPVLELAIANAVLKSGFDFCVKIKAKNYMARGDGNSAQSGCVR